MKISTRAFQYFVSYVQMYFSKYCIGGYTTGSKELIDILRQKSRPYLFSNTLPPPVVAGARKVRKMSG